MKIILETAEKRDFNDINSIVKEGHDEHAEALPHIFKKVDPVMPEAYFHELMEDQNSEILVAKESGDIVGFAVMELSESPKFESLIPRKFAYINDFGIKRNYQRKGIGKFLFNECVEWAKVRGASSLDLNVWEFNKKAISFYEKYGMGSVSRKMTMPL